MAGARERGCTGAREDASPLHLAARVARNFDRLAVANQRVDRTVADVGLRRLLVGLAALLGGAAQMSPVVHAGCVEGRRNDRRQQP